ncbi:hypothetical protein P7C73_g1364, partial [Tremellales sp. Uapishka_1]
MHSPSSSHPGFILSIPPYIRCSTSAFFQAFQGLASPSDKEKSVSNLGHEYFSEEPESSSRNVYYFQTSLWYMERYGSLMGTVLPPASERDAARWVGHHFGLLKDGPSIRVVLPQSLWMESLVFRQGYASLLTENGVLPEPQSIFKDSQMLRFDVTVNSPDAETASLPSRSPISMFDRPPRAASIVPRSQTEESITNNDVAVDHDVSAEPNGTNSDHADVELPRDLHVSPHLAPLTSLDTEFNFVDDLQHGSNPAGSNASMGDESFSGDQDDGIEEPDGNTPPPTDTCYSCWRGGRLCILRSTSSARTKSKSCDYCIRLHEPCSLNDPGWNMAIAERYWDQLLTVAALAEHYDAPRSDPEPDPTRPDEIESPKPTPLSRLIEMYLSNHRSSSRLNPALEKRQTISQRERAASMGLGEILDALSEDENEEISSHSDIPDSESYSSASDTAPKRGEGRARGHRIVKGSGSAAERKTGKGKGKGGGQGSRAKK